MHPLLLAGLSASNERRKIVVERILVSGHQPVGRALARNEKSLPKGRDLPVVEIRLRLARTLRLKPGITTRRNRAGNPHGESSVSGQAAVLRSARYSALTVL